jgi:hypothetical protein
LLFYLLNQVLSQTILATKVIIVQSFSLITYCEAVFKGRYKSIPIEKHSYLLELARYIVLNPMRANMLTVAVD